MVYFVKLCNSYLSCFLRLNCAFDKKGIASTLMFVIFLLASYSKAMILITTKTKLNIKGLFLKHSRTMLNWLILNDQESRKKTCNNRQVKMMIQWGFFLNRHDFLNVALQCGFFMNRLTKTQTYMLSWNHCTKINLRKAARFV